VLNCMFTFKFTFMTNVGPSSKIPILPSVSCQNSGLVASVPYCPGPSFKKVKVEIPISCLCRLKLSCSFLLFSALPIDLDLREINPIAIWSRHLPLLLQRLALLQLVSWVRKAPFFHFYNFSRLANMLWM
jgi:hypothetical protein